MGTPSQQIQNADGTLSGTKLFATLRARQPVRKLALHEHLSLAEQQAALLHSLLGQTGPAAELSWLASLHNVTLELEPRWRMDSLSGFSKYADGHWIIGVNKQDPHARRRFTLCHELKHVLDGSRDRVTYAGISDRQREQIADYFAACYLMPKRWLRKAWVSGIQDPEALAGLFRVSLAAMNNRLRYLGYLDDEPERPVRTYFRESLLGNFDDDNWLTGESAWWEKRNVA